MIIFKMEKLIVVVWLPAHHEERTGPFEDEKNVTLLQSKVIYQHEITQNRIGPTSK
jgi:hypothetical protein